MATLREPVDRRPRWLSKDAFVRQLAGNQADHAFAAERHDLAPDTTDDVPLP